MATCFITDFRLTIDADEARFGLCPIMMRQIGFTDGPSRWEIAVGLGGDCLLDQIGILVSVKRRDKEF